MKFINKLENFFENNMIAWWLIHIVFVIIMFIGFIFALLII